VAAAPPTILGHAAAGVVEEVGAHVERVRAGDRVVVAGTPECGECFWCIRDQPDQCAGGDDLQVVLPLHPGHQEREETADEDAEGQHRGQRAPLLRKDPDQRAGDEPLEGRSDDDPRELSAHFRGEVRGEAIEDPEKAAEQRRKQHFSHANASTPSITRSMREY